MNRHNCLTASLCLMVWVSVAACASPTIRDTIQLRRVMSPEVSPDVGISEVYAIGGDGGDWAQNIFCSQDGSYTVFGETLKSFGESTDFLAVRVLPGHKIDWAKTYGGPHKDSLRDVISAPDGGYLMLGRSQSLFFTPLPGNKESRPFLVKITDSGAPQWAVTLDGEKGSWITEMNEVIPTKDGGYVLAGEVRIEIKKDTFRWNTAIVKLTRNGEPLWAYRYDQGGDDTGNSVKELADGSLIAMGSKSEHAGARAGFFMLKIDAAGLPLWAKSYSSADRLYVSSLLLLGKDDLLIVGGVVRNPEDLDLFAAKATSSGDMIWARAYGSPRRDQPISAAKGPPGEYIITGRSGSVKERLQDGVAVIIDDDGKLKTSSFIGGPLNDDLRSASFFKEGKYRIALSTESFNATYSDILTAVWSPRSSRSSSAFSEMDLHIATTDIEMKKIPVTYRHVPLAVNTDLIVKGMSTEAKAE